MFADDELKDGQTVDKAAEAIEVLSESSKDQHFFSWLLVFINRISLTTRLEKYYDLYDIRNL